MKSFITAVALATVGASAFAANAAADDTMNSMTALQQRAASASRILGRPVSYAKGTVFVDAKDSGLSPQQQRLEAQRLLGRTFIFGNEPTVPEPVHANIPSTQQLSRTGPGML